MKELARNKQAIQSSTAGSMVARNAVDGKQSTIAKTNLQNNPYWSVDLGEVCYIDHLYINSVFLNGEFFSRSLILFYCNA